MTTPDKPLLIDIAVRDPAQNLAVLCDVTVSVDRARFKADPAAVLRAIGEPLATHLQADRDRRDARQPRPVALPPRLL